MDTGQTHGPTEPPAALMERLLDRERDRNDRLMADHASVLGRIEQRIIAIETRIGEALTPSQWVKAAAGIALPIAALWLTGSAELARSLLPHP
jgi:hypothetical protein